MEIKEPRLGTEDYTKGIIPGFREVLMRRWNGLLVKPEITHDPDKTIKGYEVASLAYLLNDNPNTKKMVVVTESGELRVLWFHNGHKLNNSQELNIIEYINFAPHAERALVDLHDQQEKDLKEKSDSH